jgi:hypothetical protein
MSIKREIQELKKKKKNPFIIAKNRGRKPSQTPLAGAQLSCRIATQRK